MAARGVRFLASDIWDTPEEDGNVYEVIDGVMYVTPIPWWTHQMQLSHLGHFVSCRVHEHDLGSVTVGCRTGVVLDERTGMLPDLLFISHARKHLISKRGVEGAPDLLVEVLS